MYLRKNNKENQNKKKWIIKIINKIHNYNSSSSHNNKNYKMKIVILLI